MSTIELSLLPARFEYLAKNYREEAIKVLSRNEEFVTFEITIRGPWDVLDLFHAGVSYGIDISVPWKSK
jgi:hypothetical protein